jgi:hypothetical protein
VPFTKTGRGKYVSPSGKLYTAKQVKAYYATGGFNHPPKKKGKRRGKLGKR